MRLEFLNAPYSGNSPNIWLDVLHKGVKLKYRNPQQEMLGVPKGTAAVTGMVLGILLLLVIIVYIESVWLGSSIAFIYGLFVQIPGALVVKTWRRIRDWSAG